ncbi:hypothetical protein ARSQ2_00642 [Arsenophonus endosymbiont of Bemisia tabaci Q2]|nr:hypothetical protein ARSQ2_00642 [Arsenophonus endosymbiont of Bemisia tabaci Q2]
MHVAKVDAKFDPTIYITIGAANFLALAGGIAKRLNFHYKIKTLSYIFATVQLVDWVYKLHDGLNTLLGEQGKMLSAG